MSTQHKPVLEPRSQAFIDTLNAQGGKPIYELSYEDARKVLEDAQAGRVTTLPSRRRAAIERARGAINRGDTR